MTTIANCSSVNKIPESIQHNDSVDKRVAKRTMGDTEESKYREIINPQRFRRPSRPYVRTPSYAQACLPVVNFVPMTQALGLSLITAKQPGHPLILLGRLNLPIDRHQEIKSYLYEYFTQDDFTRISHDHVLSCWSVEAIRCYWTPGDEVDQETQEHGVCKREHLEHCDAIKMAFEKIKRDNHTEKKIFTSLKDKKKSTFVYDLQLHCGSAVSEDSLKQRASYGICRSQAQNLPQTTNFNTTRASRIWKLTEPYTSQSKESCEYPTLETPMDLGHKKAENV
ncbi:hypothetical protein J6590_013820 [Homalodisca vitripennis]|nr:hypothetical protein J6590_013820 [Homalodisca vitripennis]